MNDVA